MLKTLLRPVACRINLSRKQEENYRQNPSRYGLGTGFQLGALNGLLTALLFAAFVPEAATVSFILFCVTTGFMIGLFVGGLAGLVSEWKGAEGSELLAVLTVIQGLFLAVVFAGVLLQILS